MLQVFRDFLHLATIWKSQLGPARLGLAQLGSARPGLGFHYFFSAPQKQSAGGALGSPSGHEGPSCPLSHTQRRARERRAWYMLHKGIRSQAGAVRADVAQQALSNRSATAQQQWGDRLHLGRTESISMH